MASDASVRTKNQETARRWDRSWGQIGERRNEGRTLSGQEKRPFAGLLWKPSDGLEPSTPPYHEREEGADPCGFARSGAGSSMSPVAARRRVLHGGATLVRPG